MWRSRMPVRLTIQSSLVSTSDFEVLVGEEPSPAGSRRCP
jgi:hypothetical protein